MEQAFSPPAPNGGPRVATQKATTLNRHRKGIRRRWNVLQQKYTYIASNHDLFLLCSDLRQPNQFMGADKSSVRPGRKQANVSVRMAWISFGALPCRKKKQWWQFAARCCWNRASLWHSSELVSFLVGLRTYQHPGIVTRLRTGRPRNRISISYRDRGFSSSPLLSDHIDGHLPSYPKGSSSSFLGSSAVNASNWRLSPTQCRD